MKKLECKTCGYSYEKVEDLKKCPHCDKNLDCMQVVNFDDINVIGIGKDVNQEILESLRTNFIGECTEVGMYIAMSNQAEREGYPEIAQAFKKIAYEEAEHAGKFAEILGEVLEASTENNLKVRSAAEFGAYEGKKNLSKKLKELNLDAIYHSMYEIYKDEGRHGKIFQSLLSRYFEKK